MLLVNVFYCFRSFLSLGGGQPSDKGMIQIILSGASSSNIFQFLPTETPAVSTIENEIIGFEVLFVQSNPENEQIEHYGYPLHPFFLQFLTFVPLHLLTFQLKINQEWRRMNSHLHSLGHLIDAGMKIIGYDETFCKPTKGHHFQDGSFVEYEIIDNAFFKDLNNGKEGEKILEKIRNDLQVAVETLIQEKIETIVHFEAISSSSSSSSSTGAQTSEIPDEKPMRVVNIAGCSCPCGGTHIKNTQEISETVIIQKIKRKKNILKVSYSIDSPVT
jgi:Ser-tRNA(Ala) deacylase AlaX